MTFELSDQQIAEAYEKRVKPALLTMARSQEPTAVFLAGQPGGGKSHLADESILLLKTPRALVIDVDTIRAFHPSFENANKEDLYAALDKSFSYKVIDLLYKDAVARGVNIVFDGTLGGEVATGLKEKFADLKSKGYRISINALSVHDVVSKIGFNFRFHNQYRKNPETARRVDLTYHNLCYERIPENLRALGPLADTVSLFGRNHVMRKIEKLQDFDIASDRSQINPALDAYLTERRRPFTEKEINGIKNFYGTLLSVATQNGLAEGEVRNIIHTDDHTVSVQTLNQIDRIIGLDENTIKELNRLRGGVRETVEKIAGLQKFNGEQLMKVALPVIEMAQKNMERIKERIDKIIKSAPADTGKPEHKKSIRNKLR